MHAKRAKVVPSVSLTTTLESVGMQQRSGIPRHTCDSVIKGQVRLLWPVIPHSVQVFATPMLPSERACRASKSALLRNMDSAMRLHATYLHRNAALLEA